MVVNELRIDRVNTADQTFRISESLDSDRLRASLEAIGQLNPVILLPGEGRLFRLVTGFRRVHLLRELGYETVFARCLEPSSSDPLRAFLIALGENLEHRDLNPLERSRALVFFSEQCKLDPEEIVHTYHPLLGLEPHIRMFRSHLQLSGLEPALKSFLIGGKITASTAYRLARLDPEEQRAAALLYAGARWSASLQARLLDLMDDLRASARLDFPRLVARDEIQAILLAPGTSEFQRGEAIFSWLFRKQHPRLTAAETEFRRAVLDLGLAGTVQVKHHPFFEKQGLRAEFEAANPADFRTAVRCLERAAGDSRLDNLFEVR